MIFRSRANIFPAGTWKKRSEISTKQAETEKGLHEAIRAVYADEAVKQALEQIFAGKCCYCEFRVGVGADWDVEHFRPKGRVNECPGHPGYYWLAYHWENLLPSCTYCNQARKDRATQNEPESPAAGKLDQFPLLDENFRCMDHLGNISLERPFLINPTEEDPELHITFAPDGYAIGLSERGERTIEICNLNRRRLRDDRRTKLDSVIELARLLQTNYKEIQDKVNAALLRSAAGDKAYAGVARAYLRHPERF